MVSVVFIIAMLNMVGGFLLAIAFERQTVVYVPSFLFRRGSSIDDVDVADDDRSTSLVAEQQFAAPDPTMVEQIPTDWVKILEEADLEHSSFIESTVQVVKLRVDRYRDGLIDVEDRVRSGLEKKNSLAVSDALATLTQLNDEWLEEIQGVLAVLSGFSDSSTSQAESGMFVEQLLLDQLSETEAINDVAKELNVDADDGAAKKLHEFVVVLVGMAHRLRDAMHDSLVAVFRNEDRMDSIDRRQWFDPLTGLQNRLGIEILFWNWLREDSERMRSVTIALADIDGFTKINREFGTRAGDRFIGTVGRYLENLISNDSGLNRVTRLSGQRFLFFLGDARPRKSISEIEGIRQSIEAATFVIDESEVRLTIGNAVTELQLDETTTELFERLDGLLKTAKENGGNRSVLDDGNGPDIVAARKKEMASRRIAVN